MALFWILWIIHRIFKPEDTEGAPLTCSQQVRSESALGTPNLQLMSKAVGWGGTVWRDCTLNLWGGLTQGRWITEEWTRKSSYLHGPWYPPGQRRQTQAHSSNQDFIQGDTPPKLGRLTQGERQVRGRRKECQGRPFSPQSKRFKDEEGKSLRMETWPCPSLIIIKQDNPEKKASQNQLLTDSASPKSSVCNIDHEVQSLLELHFPIDLLHKIMDMASGSSADSDSVHTQETLSQNDIQINQGPDSCQEALPLHQLTQALMYTLTQWFSWLYCENELTGNLVKMTILIL